MVKHYLQDVGSTFGMANPDDQWENGWEHFYEGGLVAKRLASFGFALSPWATTKFSQGPAIGKFEGDRFDPQAWKTHAPSAASIQMRDDDAFWAARRVAAFTDDMIRAVVHTGEFSDPVAEKTIADILIKRRNRIVRTYLPAVNPIVTPHLENDRLTFDNAAVAVGVAVGPEGYIASWFQFDNTTGETRPLGATGSHTTSIAAPRGLPVTTGSFIAVDLSANCRDYPGWMQPVRTYFRRDADGWRWVGLDRMPGGRNGWRCTRRADSGVTLRLSVQHYWLERRVHDPQSVRSRAHMGM